MSSDLIIGMAGAGGDGIVSAGESLMAAAAMEGYHAILTKSFGSQIRGGESSARLRVSTSKVLNSGGTLDVLVALNWEEYLKFGAELPVGGETVVIYESGARTQPVIAGVTPAEVLPVPISEMAREIVGSDKAKNIVMLGLIAGWFDLAPNSIVAGIRKRFAKKGPEFLQANEKAYQAGVDYAAAHPLKTPRTLTKPEAEKKGKILLTDGNDISAAAAIFAGCDFFGGYPITPSSEVMQFLGRELPKFGGSVVQCEDEIAGIGTCVGASFAGKKVLTATSGPGMALKSEILGLASIAELPLVCINVQRGGPSTGLPTKSEQADLFQAIFSANGDVIRPVLAPINVSDTFAMTVEAFNIAEQYQTPVIILSDQDIAQRKETVDPIDTSQFKIVNRRVPTETELENYTRFRFTSNGVSPLSHPGMPGGNYLASGIEHTETGAPTARGETHAKMVEKRHRKFDSLKQRRELFYTEGDSGAPIGIVSWGSVAGVAIEALRIARAKGMRVKLLVPKLLFPVSEEIYEEFFASVQRGLVVEQSYQAQLYRVIRMYVDLPAKRMETLAKCGSNPIIPKEVVARIRALSLALQGEREPEMQSG